MAKKRQQQMNYPEIGTWLSSGRLILMKQMMFRDKGAPPEKKKCKRGCSHKKRLQDEPKMPRRLRKNNEPGEN